MNILKIWHKVFLAASFVFAAVLIAAFVLSGRLTTVSSQDKFTVENNIDRPGGDYKDFDLSEAKYQQCQNACANDSSCQSYTFVRPGVQGSKARCWLKNTVPASGESSCCISGVKKGGGGENGVFSGDWYAGEWSNITFNQNGNEVNGTYTRGNGTIYGTASGNRLDATWQQSGRTGTVYFIVQNGTLEGKYCEGSGCSPENGTYFSGRRR